MTTERQDTERQDPDHLTEIISKLEGELTKIQRAEMTRVAVCAQTTIEVAAPLDVIAGTISWLADREPGGGSVTVRWHGSGYVLGIVRAGDTSATRELIQHMIDLMSEAKP